MCCRQCSTNKRDNVGCDDNDYGSLHKTCAFCTDKQKLITHSLSNITFHILRYQFPRASGMILLHADIFKSINEQQGIPQLKYLYKYNICIKTTRTCKGYLRNHGSLLPYQLPAQPISTFVLQWNLDPRHGNVININ
jgi:hypothetical protein